SALHGCDRGGRFLVAIPDPRDCPDRSRRGFAANPIHVGGRQRDPLERSLRTDRHGRGRGVDVDNVKRNPGGEPESLPLPDCEPVHALVAAEHVAAAILNDATLNACAAPDEIRVLAGSDEADLLAVLLIGDAQSESPSLLADRTLIEAADGEARPGQLRLRKRKQEVRLVLLTIGAA